MHCEDMFLLVIDASKTHFIHLSHNYNAILDKTQPKPRFSCCFFPSGDLPWIILFPFLNKLNSWVFLKHLQDFFTPSHLLTPYRSVARPCMDYPLNIYSGSTHLTLLERVKSRQFRFIISSLLTFSSLILPLKFIILLIALMKEIAFQNFPVAHLLHWGFVRHNFILSLTTLLVPMFILILFFIF